MRGRPAGSTALPLAELERRLGTRVTRAARVTGGDVNDAHRLELADGRSAFLKTSPAAPAGAFEAEARGLRWLGDAGALRVPEVLASSDAPGPEGFLLLSWIERGAPGAGHDEELGRGLAAMHRAGSATFGGTGAPAFLANLPMDDRPATDVATFWSERRLLPLLARIERQGRSSPRLRAGIERVCRKMPELVGPAEPPARIHGDLWGGNTMPDAAGRPVLFDPAATGGHREIDLAMMRLFGGFSRRVFDAYAEAAPLAPGHEERVPLWQLVPLLVHVALFGGGWARRAEVAVGALA